MGHPISPLAVNPNRKRVPHFEFHFYNIRGAGAGDWPGDVAAASDPTATRTRADHVHTAGDDETDDRIGLSHVQCGIPRLSVAMPADFSISSGPHSSPGGRIVG